jgi:hypothetical protein
VQKPFCMSTTTSAGFLPSSIAVPPCVYDRPALFENSVTAFPLPGLEVELYRHVGPNLVWVAAIEVTDDAERFL